ncbi:MAG: D-alanyl-D-alanine carboxypeptidase [Betaproteobacteria bacterium]|nr:D-alanyl-D-alanine carboxypeptidase [Betaproteobacteria bacterium]
MKTLPALLFVSLFATADAMAAPPPLPVVPLPAVPVIPAPQLNATAYILEDYDSGQILAQYNPDMHAAPASLTKLMTAFITLSELSQHRLSLTQMMPVSVTAWKTGGSRMFLSPNTQVSVHDLLLGMLVPSGNDAATTLAQDIGGTEAAFVQMMNEEAAQLGMKNTHYADATGLPEPDHYTTARDLATLARAIIGDFPQYYHLFGHKWFEYDNIRQPNFNHLLFMDPTVDGLKTGHTAEAGYCLVASAKRGGRRLISVVLGDPTDMGSMIDSENLLNYGFRAFDNVLAYRKGQAVAQLSVWKGTQSTVPAGLAEDVVLSLPKGEAHDLKASLTSRQPLVAPIAPGTRVGTLTLTLKGKALGSYPVVALKPVGLANFFGRTWDRMKLFVKAHG